MENESTPQAKYFVYPNFVDKNTSTFHVKEAKKARMMYVCCLFAKKIESYWKIYVKSATDFGSILRWQAAKYRNAKLQLVVNASIVP
ncbi:hypothetical protein WN51_11899 [Melipona quadrifasciata]|uniref:Uncharacterized protein n=1 Tax=Melipona quadrifasciata TaxID=166423 RepID=A0A0M9A5A8_9HYME|nr:hypothetical protein WN51_11899 [Melipona quadrifasciata]